MPEHGPHAKRPESSPRARRRYGGAAMAGVVVYAGVDVVLQALPPHYSPVREAESNLAVGPFGWVMKLNFLGRAATTLCLVQAVARTGPASRRRSAGAALLGIGGACSGVLAFFTTDIRGADAAPGGTTRIGTVHLVVAGGGFAAALAGITILTGWLRRNPALRRTGTAATACAGLAAAGLGSLGLAGRFFPAFLGLAERIALAGILGWAFAVSAGLRSLKAEPAI
ncbi:DUF998 domain-containing protein [Specibacter sp. RAF43]|uniref:DUF998 domain-containing protein n=1 Tax=Specibacter sp. RAF43 TaxID=3233057 RepID=UPI003F9D9DE9